MTTFTGDLNIKALDSSTTAATIERGGGATFTGPVTFVSSVAITGTPTFASGSPVSAFTLTSATNPVSYGSITNNVMNARGTVKITVDGTTAYIPFFYGGS